MKSLLVLMDGRLSDLVEKGEMVPRYFNPANAFDRVHVVLTNDDSVLIDEVRGMAGDATLLVDSIGPVRMRRTAAWRPRCLSPWVSRVAAIVESESVDTIWALGAGLAGGLAGLVSRKCGTRLVVSLHGQPQERMQGERAAARVMYAFRGAMRRIALQSADDVICVYRELVQGAASGGAHSVRVIHNFVGGDCIVPKHDYGISGRARVLSVGRLIQGKDPSNILAAIAKLDCELTLVGSGELEAKLRRLTSSMHVTERVRFVSAMPNADLCRVLSEYDVFAATCTYAGFPKTLIEALLSALPCVVNDELATCLPGSTREAVVACHNDPAGYAGAIGMLLEDHDARRAHGTLARVGALPHFDPAALERDWAEALVGSFTAAACDDG